MKIKVCIFDLDGTLLDTLEDISDAMNSVLKRMKLPLHTSKEYLKYIGDGLESFVKQSLPKEYQSDESLLNEAVQGLKTEYSKTWHIKTKPFEGIMEMLDELKKRDIKMAVLSNKLDRFTKEMVEYYFENKYFNIVLGSREGIPRKPNPHSIFEILNEFNEKPENALYIGDSKYDMKAAVNANMKGIGVLWGFGTREEMEENKAYALISKPIELLNFL